MAVLYDNFLSGTITDSPLTSGATTINSSAFANLPVVSGGNIMYLTLDADSTDGAPEVVTVTAHSSSATSITVTRASQGSSAREHLSGTDWVHSFTKLDAERVGTPDDGSVDTDQLAADAVTGAKIADDAIDSEHYTDASIDAAHIASSAVTTAKINDAAVTNAKLGPNVGAWANIDGNTQSITTGTNTDVIFGSASGAGSDPWNWHDSGSNPERVTPTIAGVYLVLARVTWEAAGGNGSALLDIEKNGTAVTVESVIALDPSDRRTVSCQIILAMNGSTDYFNCAVEQDTGGTVDIADSDMMVILLRAN